jgi:hypothetical protein
MIGVIILALGLPPVFHSLDEGHRIDNGVSVAGYVVMRVAMPSCGYARPGRIRRDAAPARPTPSPSVLRRSAGFC